MDLKVGDIINAAVVKTEHYGVYLRYEEHFLLVLIPYTSWTACFGTCHQLADVGDEFLVLINVVSASGQIGGSFCEVYPENNPWSGAWKLAVGDRITAKVFRIVESADRCGGARGYLLELKPAVYAMLCSEGLQELEEGQFIQVIVDQVYEERHAIKVTLAR